MTNDEWDNDFKNMAGGIASIFDAALNAVANIKQRQIERCDYFCNIYNSNRKFMGIFFEKGPEIFVDQEIARWRQWCLVAAIDHLDERLFPNNNATYSQAFYERARIAYDNYIDEYTGDLNRSDFGWLVESLDPSVAKKHTPHEKVLRVGRGRYEAYKKLIEKGISSENGDALHYIFDAVHAGMKKSINDLNRLSSENDALFDILITYLLAIKGNATAKQEAEEFHSAHYQPNRVENFMALYERYYS